MIHKTRSPSFPTAYLHYLFNRADPQEEWHFEQSGLHGRVVNGWRSGLSLFVGEECLASTNRMVAVGGPPPLLTAEVTDANGQRRKIEVFARAIFTVKIRIVVDGRPLHRRYV
ncbi:hypothetical protein LAJ19_16165 (plasmid) [Deinococcus taeanensis]|uniref:hypothetical protein n=1 Tax=Deinococcus taeanensis TaxID=2737050 RepID=UPI001CDC0C38|nr:hypothetical protein [Deinococcus taeanensis]UBV44695.1 hypothetical protein LAJ19_16165 [Deinococcus taeanensis]